MNSLMKHPASALLFAAAALLRPGTTCAAPDATGAEPPVPDVVQFNRDIRPIFSDTCFFCHGPDAKHRKADLRLDIEAEAKAKHDEIIPIVPGSLEKSEIWRLINAAPDERMPPVKSNKSLTPRQIAVVKKWIEQGAKYEGHWAFETPKKPALPNVDASLRDAKLAASQSDAAPLHSWPKNPIDRFILDRMLREGLRPSPEADRETLIRRVSYDLAGLPPTLAAIDAFVNDKSPDAYEKMVDRYLASPAFGERMTLAWLDAARYGDTSVFHADGPRDMWPWRNWVIDAYNDNMPFDQFTVEQLAGDLMDDDKSKGLVVPPTGKRQPRNAKRPELAVNMDPAALEMLSRKIASGFNRNNGTTDEGGAIDEEYRVEYVVDRVKTVSNVWLGISMECGQCHDHKYDPISQKEYYGFYAFFNQTSDPGMQTRNGNQAPLVPVPDPKKEAEAAELRKQVAAFDQKIAEHAKQVEPAFLKWAAQMSAKASAGGKPAVPGDVLAHFTLDETQGNAVTDVVDPKRTGAVKGAAKWQPGKFGNGFHVDRNNWIEFGKDVANFDRTDAFSYGCWIKPDDAGNGTPLAKMDDAAAYRGYDMYITNGSVAVHIVSTWPSDAIKVNTKNKVKAKDWTHVFITYDGSSKASGIKIYFDGKEQEWTVEADALKSTTKGNAPLQVGRRHPSAGFAGVVDDVRIYARALTATEVAALSGSDPLGPILALPLEKRTPQQVQTLRTHYLQTEDKEYVKLQGERAKMAAQVEALSKSNVTVMVMGEMPNPRPTHLLMRGHYASPDKSEVIKPDVPAVFPKLPDGAPRNRLGLAQWLVDPKHPLTARVAVNRHWALVFGEGIVSTVMDFGSQGAWPSHPELLDWLAGDFVESDWDVKRAFKQMLMSATYRQSSRLTSELAAKDPKNRLLARGPRFRLQGEFIRDSALAAGGLLIDQVGGPSTKPYQPPGLWFEVSLTGERFVQDKGEKLYRKSMYIYWKRSAPHPGMLIFDAPTREKCVVGRPITNTPLQALYTLNDTQFVEASRFLAQRMMLEGGATPAERITFAYRVVTSRRPSERALATLTGLYNAELAKYKADAERTKKLLAIGESPRDAKLDAVEHAAWTVVASTILNMDAAMVKY